MRRPARSGRTVIAALPWLALALAAWAMPLRAQPVGDPVAGRDLAATYCSQCHVMPPNDDEGRDGAPAFIAIARMPSTTAMSLHAFLLTPHPTMPNVRLHNTEIDDLVAYILDLRRR